jgi:hypothetical protein
MIDLNELRDRAATFGSDYLTDEEWVEVIDRLEAAERNLNCCQGERMEAAALFLSVKTRLTEERDALRAKIEAMERQEPVGVLHVGSYYGEELEDWEFEANQCACDKLNEAYVHNPTSLPLYALPGAKGE